MSNNDTFLMVLPQALKIDNACPGWVAQSVRASSQYAKVAGSIPGQGTYESQPTNA